MRCHDAKLWLAAQRDGGLAPSDVPKLQEHLENCPVCQAYEQHQHCLHTMLTAPAPRTYSSISTERIMLAVEQQRRITQQLEEIRTQQQSRMVRLRIVGPSLAAIIFFTLASIPLLLLAMAIIQPDLMVKTLAFLSGIIDVFIVVGQYLQSSLTLVARNSWLLSGVALILVVMMGMWLRLMRYPQEA